MNILMASSELAPVAEAGQLARSVRSLGDAMSHRVEDMAVFLPAYESILREHGDACSSTGVTLEVPMGDEACPCEVLECGAAGDIQVFLARADRYFGRPGLYGPRGGAYEDNAERFVFFSKAVVELARRLTPRIDLIHLHDWPAAMAAPLVKSMALPIQTVLTVHAPRHQESLPLEDLVLTGLDLSVFIDDPAELPLSLNLLRAGVRAADMVVDPRLSGGGAEGKPASTGVFELAGERFRLIADGATQRPETSSLARGESKARLAEELGLRDALDLPWFFVPSGDLWSFLPLLDRLMAMGAVVAVEGPAGSPAEETTLRMAAIRYPGAFVYLDAVDEERKERARLAGSGADFAIVTSGGEAGPDAKLSAALSAGCVPVMRMDATLRERIAPMNGSGEEGAVLDFYEDNPEALWGALLRALELHRRRRTEPGGTTRPALTSRTWDDAADDYAALYASLTNT